MKEIKRDKITTRTRNSTVQFRAEQTGDENFLEGYFSVFGDIYELWPGASESIDPHAFDETLSEDIRALIDHDTAKVLGRNKSGTLELKVDSRGLWGRIKVNQEDTDAMNLYSRVERGDIDGCSFGFQVLEEDVEFREDGTVHWTIKKVKLFEVSICTFPAYEDTSITARKNDYEQIKRRQVQLWKKRMKERLKRWH